MSSRISMVFRFLAVVIFVVVVAVGGVATLTSTDPGVLLQMLTGRRPLPAVKDRPPASVASEVPELPVFSESYLEDVGSMAAIDFEALVNEQASLAEVASSRIGRADRGIAEMTRTLHALGTPQTDEARIRAANALIVIGGLQMFDGRFEEARETYERARAIHPDRPSSFADNLEAMLGVVSMRRGEIENCVACCTNASCIFPLAPSAVHRQTAGSRRAIQHFTRYLEKRPDDLGVRWLLNVAYMTLNEYPHQVPPKDLIPLEPFQSRVDIGRFPNVSAQVGLFDAGENDAGACIVDDFNGDDLLDLFTSNVDPEGIPRLFLNQGDGQFKEVGRTAGFDGQVGAANATHADIDNDGDLDILLLRGGWEWAKRPSLMRNRGDGTFEDVTASAGLMSPIASHSGAWADYDNDGFVDLYLVGEFAKARPDRRKPSGGPDPHNKGRLYHNNRDGTFTDVAAEAGVENLRWGKGAAWGDYDNDGDPDLYVSNNAEYNRLYRNEGNGKFTDVALNLGVIQPLASFSCWWWDYDNDGLLDLFVANFNNSLPDVIRSHLGQPTKGERPRLFHNEGKDGFRDVTSEAGLDRVLVCMGSNFGDVNNDGFLDLYLATGRPEYRFLVPNVLFCNIEGTKFEDITTSSGTGHLQKGHGVSFADWDRDGDVDVFLESGGATPGDRAHNALFQNPGQGNHWINVRLTGTKTNRAAIGARIRVDLPGPDGSTLPRRREITSGSSYGGNPFAVTIGLGKAESIKTLEVFWPTSRITQTFHNVPVDRWVEITEGRESVRILDVRPLPSP